MPEINDNNATSLLVNEILTEKRAERRWKNIRFVFWFTLFAVTIAGLFNACSNSPTPSTSLSSKKSVALIRLNGMIAPGNNFSAETVLPILQSAFADKSTNGVIIDIDSPGGTPVQAAIIHDAIIAYKNRYHKKVVIVGEDLLTSGAYFVAVAGDKIYVNPNTLTGSIGVIMKGFGFVDLMKKMGVERRVYIAGTDKDRLDPFLPQTPEDLKKIQEVMGEVHSNFVQAVIAGRQNKLHGNHAMLFSGDFWSGQTAKNLGLVDGLGNLMDVMDKEFNTTHFKEFGGTPNFLRMLTGQVSSSFDSMIYAA